MNIHDLNIWNVLVVILIVFTIGGVLTRIRFRDKSLWCPHCCRNNKDARKETGNTKSKYTDNRGILFTDFEYKCELCDCIYWTRKTEHENKIVKVEKSGINGLTKK